MCFERHIERLFHQEADCEFAVINDATSNNSKGGNRKWGAKRLQSTAFGALHFVRRVCAAEPFH